MRDLTTLRDLNWKTLVFVMGAAALLVGCTQSTEPAREDTSCRSGYNVSSGKKPCE